MELKEMSGSFLEGWQIPISFVILRSVVLSRRCDKFVVSRQKESPSDAQAATSLFGTDCADGGAFRSREKQ